MILKKEYLKTPLANWFARSNGNKFAIKRLVDSEKILNESNLDKLKKVASISLEKNYDKIMNDRYGNNPPLEENVISPSAIFDSDKLITILESNN